MCFLNELAAGAHSEFYRMGGGSGGVRRLREDADEPWAMVWSVQRFSFFGAVRGFLVRGSKVLPKQELPRSLQVIMSRGQKQLSWSFQLRVFKQHGGQ